ncbi:MAG TPA: type I restriction-modification system endonuclease, partial [Longimicrobium sp.]|nr:type I restriction-modification system endonuclease [Longimicrobium sp.]
MPIQPPPSLNFGFLADYDPLLVRLGGLAEVYADHDPNTAIIKLRQFGEVMLQQAAGRLGIGKRGAPPNQAELIRELALQGLLSREVADLFHVLRKAGNAAAHELSGTPGEAVHLLKVARELAIWYRRTFDVRPDFRPGAFVHPRRVEDPAAALRGQLEQLRAEVDEQRRRAEEQGFAAEMEAELRRDAEYRARAVADERDVALQMAQEVEALLAQERVRFTAEVDRARALTQGMPPAVRDDLVERINERAEIAAAEIELSEADTRRLIDRQLREAGWQADTAELRWSAGARPQAEKNLAIAEWPTAEGPTDYVLFVGLVPIGVVEAKRQALSVSGAVEQAKRYSRGYVVKGEETLAGMWGTFRVPFLFATNGRDLVPQVRDRTGVWMLDARRPANHPHPLHGWYTPEGLAGLLRQDVARAEQTLRESDLEYLPLRDYQRQGVRAVEQALEEGRRSILLAMATGTGKTRVLLGLIYRLLKAGRFRRVLFLVDRTALGEQALAVFKSVQLENLQSFADVYELKEPSDQAPGTETRLHLTTVQGMVRRILGGENPLPVDSFDLVVVDECHRGYTLDREMTEAELTFRSEADYVSKYKRVMEYFDAVRVGVTATPALHTVDIFGEPVFNYGYRQAVVDGWLVDHEPPVQIVTALAEDGITWQPGQTISVWRPAEGVIDLVHTPDEVSVEVEGFNRVVVTENFNRVVARRLAEEIDPFGPAKTVVFCVNDDHANLVVRLLKEAFEERYGDLDDDAVQKITAAADQPSAKVRRFRNEAYPTVAVTVDLLSTGIDVPEIVNVVFLRRIRSRILYEQMLGRGTRLRPGLYGEGRDKEVFRVFDAVRLYEALQPYSSMRPVVVNPSIPFVELVDELADDADATAGRAVLDQIVARLRRRVGGLESRGDAFAAAAGCSPRELLERLRRSTPTEAAEFFGEHPELAVVLDGGGEGGSRGILISDHPDELRRVEHGYGDGTRPDDFLESFGAYVRTHLNEIPALKAVVTRPRDLTRAQLRELRLALDTAGFPEAHLQSAWRELTNQDIAASIIGYIRQQALGSPL